MPVSRALRRLLNVREIEEEQRRLTLDSAMSELHALQHALSAARARERIGRMLLTTSLQACELTDRTAAHVEIQAAVRKAAALAPRIAAAGIAALSARQEYLEKRLERRQAQTLIEEAETQDALESARRDQQSLDETFGSRRHRKERQSREPRGASGASECRLHRPLFADLEQEMAEESPALPELGAKSQL